jgi:hypothetical protein
MLTHSISELIIRPRTMLTASSSRIEAFKVTAAQKPSRFIYRTFIKDHGLGNRWSRGRLEKLVINLADLLRAVSSSPNNGQLRQIILSADFLPADEPVGIAAEKCCGFVDLAHNIDEIECAPVILSHNLIAPAFPPDPITPGSQRDIAGGIRGMIDYFEKDRKIDLTKTLYRGRLMVDIELEVILQMIFNKTVINCCSQLQILKSSQKLYPNLVLHLRNFKRVSKRSLAEIKENLFANGMPKLIKGENIEGFKIVSWLTVASLAVLAVIAKKFGDINYYTYLKDMIFKDTDEESSDNFLRDLALQEFVELGLDQAGDFDSDIGDCGHFARIPFLTSWQLEMAKRGFRQMFSYFEWFFEQYYESLKI